MTTLVFQDDECIRIEGPNYFETCKDSLMLFFQIVTVRYVPITLI